MAGRVAALLRAERELLANVSHELRTPLARIKMALGYATEGNAEAARESFADITEDIDDWRNAGGQVQQGTTSEPQPTHA